MSKEDYDNLLLTISKTKRVEPLHINGNGIEAESIIRPLTSENDIVCDPCMGSATTGIAARKLNRKFIGVEKDRQTFAIAQRRLAE